MLVKHYRLGSLPILTMVEKDLTDKEKISVLEGNIEKMKEGLLFVPAKEYPEHIENALGSKSEVRRFFEYAKEFMPYEHKEEIKKYLGDKL